MIECRSLSEGDPDEIGLTLHLDLSTLKAEVLSKAVECQSRGLIQSFKFLSELGYSLRHVECLASNITETGEVTNSLDPSEIEVYHMAKAYYDLKEYDGRLNLENLEKFLEKNI